MHFHDEWLEHFCSYSDYGQQKKHIKEARYHKSWFELDVAEQTFDLEEVLVIVHN